MTVHADKEMICIEPGNVDPKRVDVLQPGQDAVLFQELVPRL